MSQRFVPRTKQDRGKLTDRGAVFVAKQVTLACGCSTRVAPQVSNPDRWWCHGGWQRNVRTAA